MHAFGSRRRSVSKASGTTASPSPPSAAGRKTALTGHTQVDIALQRHAEVEAQARHVSRTVQTFLMKIREQAEASAHVTQAMRSYYAGSAGEAKVRVFETAHDEVDKRLPDALLGVAQEHIVKRLDAYMNELTDVQAEIKTFHDRQSKFDHYTKKMYKLDEEHQKRSSDGKVEKPKQIEKLTRNRKKLEDARAARDEMISSLVNKLDYFYHTRISTMDPILRFLFQFQQEFYKKCGEALQVELPENTAASAHEAAANTTRPISERPRPVQTPYSFDENGNRRASMGAPVPLSSAPSSASSPPPSSSFGSPNQAQTAPFSPNSGPSPSFPVAPVGSARTSPASSRSIPERPASMRPPPPRAAPSQSVSSASSSQPRLSREDDELVDKWFSV